MIENMCNYFHSNLYLSVKVNMSLFKAMPNLYTPSFKK